VDTTAIAGELRLVDRAWALHQEGKLGEAQVLYEHDLQANPADFDTLHLFSLCLAQSGQLERGVELIGKAIAINPKAAAAYGNCAAFLSQLKRYEEALACYDRAIALKPDFAEAYSNRGNALKQLGRLDEALASYDRAIALKPDFADAYSNRGNALKQLGRLDEALASYDHAIALKLDSADARFNKGLCLLLTAQFDHGWHDYEARKTRPEAVAEGYYPPLPWPLWLGQEDTAAKTLLISAEQGLGDTLQFCRYLKLLEGRGALVIFAVQRRLRSIVATLSPTIKVIAQGETPPASVDFHCPLLSLPLTFGTRLDTIPADVPYLSAEPERVERWKRRLGSDGFKIGIAWQGHPGKVDVGRSFIASDFFTIGRIAGVRLISLQKGQGVEQLAQLPAGMTVETLGEDFDAGPDAFLDSAAAIANLDLVITSDTAIAHLAGALARPAWVALQHVPEWRWLLDRADSPWYPTLRLFRQATRGDWKGVFRAMEFQLADRLNSRPKAAGGH
jgi:Flp pilus assembly protein TadD